MTVLKSVSQTTSLERTLFVELIERCIAVGAKVIIAIIGQCK